MGAKPPCPQPSSHWCYLFLASNAFSTSSRAAAYVPCVPTFVSLSSPSFLVSADCYLSSGHFVFPCSSPSTLSFFSSPMPAPVSCCCEVKEDSGFELLIYSNVILESSPEQHSQPRLESTRASDDDRDSLAFS